MCIVYPSQYVNAFNPALEIASASLGKQSQTLQDTNLCVSVTLGNATTPPPLVVKCNEAYAASRLTTCQPPETVFSKQIRSRLG